MTDQRIYQIGLTMINGVGNILAHHLLDAFGDPERIFEERQSALEKIPGIGSNLAGSAPISGPTRIIPIA